MGVQQEPALPFASSLCGACGEVCPVKIDIPKILLELRSTSESRNPRQAEPAGKLSFRAFAWMMTHPVCMKWRESCSARRECARCN